MQLGVFIFVKGIVTGAETQSVSLVASKNTGKNYSVGTSSVGG